MSSPVLWVVILLLLKTGATLGPEKVFGDFEQSIVS